MALRERITPTTDPAAVVAGQVVSVANWNAIEENQNHHHGFGITVIDANCAVSDEGRSFPVVGHRHPDQTSVVISESIKQTAISFLIPYGYNYGLMVVQSRLLELTGSTTGEWYERHIFNLIDGDQVENVLNIGSFNDVDFSADDLYKATPTNSTVIDTYTGGSYSHLTRQREVSHFFRIKRGIQANYQRGKNLFLVCSAVFFDKNQSGGPIQVAVTGNSYFSGITGLKLTIYKTNPFC